MKSKDFQLDDADFKTLLKQNKCKHSCFVCPFCRLHLDNYKTIQQKYIETIENLVLEMEDLLAKRGVDFIQTDFEEIRAIIFKSVKIKI